MENKKGRPSKLNEDIQRRIVQALGAGNYFETACAYAGITPATGYNWMARGRKELKRRESPNIKEGSKQWLDEQPFLDFFETITRTSAEIEVKNVALIQKAAAGDDKAGIQGDWRAAAWYLERRYPKRYGKQITELQIGDSMSDEERMAKLYQLIETAKKRRENGQD